MNTNDKLQIRAVAATYSLSSLLGIFLSIFDIDVAGLILNVNASSLILFCIWFLSSVLIFQLKKTGILLNFLAQISIIVYVIGLLAGGQDNPGGVVLVSLTLLIPIMLICFLVPDIILIVKRRYFK